MYESELEAFKDRLETLELQKQMAEVKLRIEIREIESEKEEIKGKITDIENMRNGTGKYDF